MADHLTASEIKVLKALDAAAGKAASFTDLHRASGLTIRGFRTVLHRMEADLLVGRMDRHGMTITITFKGMTSLAALAQVA